MSGSKKQQFKSYEEIVLKKVTEAAKAPLGRLLMGDVSGSIASATINLPSAILKSNVEYYSQPCVQRQEQKKAKKEQQKRESSSTDNSGYGPMWGNCSSDAWQMP